MNFGKFETREQVVRRLEQPVRDYWADTGPFEKRVKPAEAMYAILAELGRIDYVAEAQRTVNGENAARAIEAEEKVRAAVDPASGECSRKIRNAGWVYGEKPCKHPAKSKFVPGKPLCGVHFRGVLDEAIRRAKFAAETAYRESGIYTDAEYVVEQDRLMRGRRENWVK